MARWKSLALGGLAVALAQLALGAPSQDAPPAAGPYDTPPTAMPRDGTPGTNVLAERVVLYEEDPNNANGERYAGTVTWRVDHVGEPDAPQLETVLRADIEIPERNMALTWSLRRNTDKSLPASHTIEVTFTLRPGFVHGGVQNVPGVLLKAAEQSRGEPLSGRSVKVTSSYFMMGLSSIAKELEHNVALLKSREWIDVPIVYTDDRRAILAIKKGPAGARAFDEAFAAWGL